MISVKYIASRLLGEGGWRGEGVRGVQGREGEKAQGLTEQCTVKHNDHKTLVFSVDVQKDSIIHLFSYIVSKINHLHQFNDSKGCTFLDFSYLMVPLVNYLSPIPYLSLCRHHR